MSVFFTPVFIMDPYQLAQLSVLFSHIYWCKLQKQRKPDMLWSWGLYFTRMFCKQQYIARSNRSLHLETKELKISLSSVWSRRTIPHSLQCQTMGALYTRHRQLYESRHAKFKHTSIEIGSGVGNFSKHTRHFCWRCFSLWPAMYFARGRQKESSWSSAVWQISLVSLDKRTAANSSHLYKAHKEVTVCAS